MGTHKDLEVWQKSLDLVDMIYDIAFPKEETYGLSSQMRRSAVSIPSNIAEGCGRNNTKELIHFLGIARGSLAEVETQTVIACRRKYISENQSQMLATLIESIGKMLFRLQESLKSKNAT